MYIEAVPNRGSPPAILLRESVGPHAIGQPVIDRPDLEIDRLDAAEGRLSSSVIGRQALDRLFDTIELADAVDRLFGDRRAVAA